MRIEKWGDAVDSRNCSRSVLIRSVWINVMVLRWKSKKVPTSPPQSERRAVHSARASWVSYVARPDTFLRPLWVLRARSLTLSPSIPALSDFVFVSIFLHGFRFPFLWPYPPR